MLPIFICYCFLLINAVVFSEERWRYEKRETDRTSERNGGNVAERESNKYAKYILTKCILFARDI